MLYVEHLIFFMASRSYYTYAICFKSVVKVRYETINKQYKIKNNIIDKFILFVMLVNKYCKRREDYHTGKVNTFILK